MATAAILFFCFHFRFFGFRCKCRGARLLKVSWRSDHPFQSYCTFCVGLFIMGIPYSAPKFGVFWGKWPPKICITRILHREDRCAPDRVEWVISDENRMTLSGSYWVWRKTAKETETTPKMVYFTLLPRRPPQTDLNQIGFGSSYLRGN